VRLRPAASQAARFHRSQSVDQIWIALLSIPTNRPPSGDHTAQRIGKPINFARRSGLALQTDRDR